VEVIEPLIAIVAAVKVDLVNVDGSRMVVPTGWFLAVCFWLTAANKVV
jgi:hypothetical protein